MRQDGDDLRLESEVPFFIYNLVLRSDSASTGAESVIDPAFWRATSRQVPMGWWVGPSDPVPNLGQHLEMKGSLPRRNIEWDGRGPTNAS